MTSPWCPMTHGDTQCVACLWVPGEPEAAPEPPFPTVHELLKSASGWCAPSTREYTL